MSRFTNDVDNVQMMLEQSMVQLVSSAFTFVGIVAMTIVLSPTLFAFALVFLIIMLITVSQIGKKSRKYFRLQQKNLGVMNGNIEESVEGMKVIKVFNHEQQAFDEFEETNESFRKAATNANFFSGIMGPCSTGINNASYATIGNAVGLSRNTVRKYVQELECRGLILTERTLIVTRDGRTQNGRAHRQRHRGTQVIR